MSRMAPARDRGFWSTVTVWTGGLWVLAALNQAISLLLEGGGWGLVRVVHLSPGWIGLFLPFTAFAGGLTSEGGLVSGRLVRRGLLVLLFSYALLGFGAPMGSYLDDKSSGADVALLYPTGPGTPLDLLELRSAIEADPPEAYSFRATRPYANPPNWIGYLIFSPMALAFYSVFSILLGSRVAKLTSGLSPPSRLNARWALGLLFGVLFFLAVVGGGEWVRDDPSRSGILAAWVPLVVPVLILGLLEFVLRFRWGRLRLSDPPSSCG